MKYLLAKYEILNILGSGSFGEVFLARDIEANRLLALKVEKNITPVGFSRCNKQMKKMKLSYEWNIYQQLFKSGFRDGIPYVDKLTITQDTVIMPMELLGDSLETRFDAAKEKGLVFDVSFVQFIGTTIIGLLEQLHNVGYIHRDIKPNNFVFGIENNASKLYMIDFGLTKRCISKSGKHIKHRTDKSLVGTARYASINVHLGFEPSRRDDLESVGYMLIYFLQGSLPWQGLKKQKNNIERIGEIKLSTKYDVLCKGIPVGFKLYLEYCRKLEFDQKPDYEYLKNTLSN